MKTTILLTTLIASMSTAELAAQSVSDAVADMDDGVVRMSFDAKDGVCGWGDQGVSFNSSGDDDWDPRCEHGPVRVAITVRNGNLWRIKSYVGGSWRRLRNSIDIGHVSTNEAVDYLLSVASDPDARVGDDAIRPAMLAADVVVWPRLVEIARDTRLPDNTQEDAVFWLGQAAAATLGDFESDDSDDMEVRKQAVFAISQQRESVAVPALMRIVRDNNNPELRKTAMFWLGQSEDPRAISVFEDILRGS